MCCGNCSDLNEILLLTLQATSQLDEIAKGVKGVTEALTGTVAAGNSSTIAEMQELADELVAWMGGSILKGLETSFLPGTSDSTVVPPRA